MNLKTQNNSPKPIDYEAKYKDLLQNMAEGYFENDLKGNITFVNAAYCRLINKPPEEILNHNFRELVSPNSVMKLTDAFSGFYNKRGGQSLWEHSFFYEDGRLKVFEISVSLLKDESGRIQGFRGFLRDMTTREGSSIPVRESEERLKTILNQMNIAILIIDPETHHIVWANPAVLRMTGCRMDEVIGSLCHRFLCPSQSGECPIRNLGPKVENSEKMLLNKNGHEISIFKSVLEIHFNGKPHLLESFINISRMKKIQQELELSKTAAENANRAKSEFLANMSHELRTPLNHIMGFSELVLDPAFGVLNEIQKEYINDIHNSSNHLLALINDILDLSKVEAGKMELEASAVAIKKLLSNSLLMVKEKSLKKGIQLNLKMEEGVPEIIVADERKIKQILYNLLANSIKFTPPGGAIVMGAGVLTSNSDDTNQTLLKIWVSDSGVGIAKENLHRIFDYFEQIENSTTKRHEGTGIGLTLTKRLAELHGGRIQAESDGEGKGSTFFFTLPI